MNTSIHRVPLRTQVADLLRNEITTRLKVGDRLETEAKLAERLGVSLLTVREALGVLAHEGLVIRQQGRGTFVAEPIPVVAVAPRVMAVMIDLDIADPGAPPYFLRLAQRLRTMANEFGHTSRLYVGHAAAIGKPPAAVTCTDFLEDLRNDRIGGVLAVGTNAYPTLLAELRSRSVPVVAGHHSFPYAVELDQLGLIDQAVGHLADLGRKRLAAITWGTQGQERLRSLAAQHGIAVHPEWLRTDRHPLEPGAGASQLRAAWDAHAEKPDALFIGDDSYLASVIAAASELKIVIPRDLAIVCGANSGITTEPVAPCTFGEFDLEETVRTMVRALDALMAGRKDVPTVTMVPCRLRPAGPA